MAHLLPGVEIGSGLWQRKLELLDAYDAVMPRVSPALRHRLGKRRADHASHAVELERLILDSDGTPTRKRARTAYLSATVATLVSYLWDELVLSTLERHEERTSGAYRDALEAELPHAVRTVLLDQFSPSRHNAHTRHTSSLPPLAHEPVRNTA